MGTLRLYAALIWFILALTLPVASPFFFFYCSADHRYLHSFPTRRSSDLLNAQSVIAAARASGANAVHPGYGFLAERGDFAKACADAGLIFVGPNVKHLDLFGDKAAARAAADRKSTRLNSSHQIISYAVFC